MRKFMIIALAMLMMSLAFFACSDSESVGPSITLFTINSSSATQGDHAPGDVLSINFEVTKGDNDLEQWEIAIISGGSKTTYKTGSLSGVSTATYDVIENYTVPSTATGQLILEVTVTDDDDLEDTKTYTINISSNMYEYNVTLGAHQSVTGSFYCALSASGTVYTVSAARTNSNKVDLIYYYGATNMATLAAPNDPTLAEFDATLQVNSWTTKRATMLHKPASAQFSAITSATQIQSAYSTTLASSKVISLANSDEVVFKTADTKYGILKITSLTTGTSGSITFSVKVEKVD